MLFSDCNKGVVIEKTFLEDTGAAVLLWGFAYQVPLGQFGADCDSWIKNKRQLYRNFILEGQI